MMSDFLLFRSKNNRTSEGAFTLIELMVVVAIIGVLASTAIPAFGKYIRKSKTSEVYTNLRKIYDGEISYWSEDHVKSTGAVITKQFVYCVTEPYSQPGADKRLGKFEIDSWSAIHFGVDSPILYSYQVETLPDPVPPPPPRAPWVPAYGGAPDPTWTAVFLARAFGDLDGNGVISEFARHAYVPAGSDEPVGDAGTFALDELE